MTLIRRLIELLRDMQDTRYSRHEAMLILAGKRYGKR